MEQGDRCICQEDEWHNAFGESDFSVSRGMRLVVKDSKFVAGTKFLSFEETPAGLFYMSIGFTPLRNYN